MTVEAYSQWRKQHQPEVIAHRNQRCVALGEHVTVQFDAELTLRYQIQEMLRIAKKAGDPGRLGGRSEVVAPAQE